MSAFEGTPNPLREDVLNGSPLRVRLSLSHSLSLRCMTLLVGEARTPRRFPQEWSVALVGRIGLALRAERNQEIENP